MDDELVKQVKERMTELPPDVRSAITSADFGKKVQAIGAKHQLHIDQIGKLEDEVLLVMLAFSDPGDFVPNVVAQLHVPEDMANIIADEVSNDILRPIRESMREFMEERAARLVHDTLTDSLPQPILESLPTEEVKPRPTIDHVIPTPAPEAMLAETPKTTVPPPPPVLPVAPVVTPPTTPAKPELKVADTALTQQIVTAPAATPKVVPDAAQGKPFDLPDSKAGSAQGKPFDVAQGKPRDYKADPYHEPIE